MFRKGLSWSYGSWVYNYQCLFATDVVRSNPIHGNMYSIQHYAIKFVSDLTQVSGFLQVSSTNKTDCHIIYYIITEILLKEALNPINQPNNEIVNYYNFLPQY